EGVVAAPQPADEVEHVLVAPHPGREAPESGEGGRGVGVLRTTADEAVHALGVRPVALDRDRRETLFLDETPGDPRAFAIELAGAVRGFAEENEPRRPGELQEGIEVPAVAGDWPRVIPHVPQEVRVRVSGLSRGTHARDSSRDRGPSGTLGRAPAAPRPRRRSSARSRRTRAPPPGRAPGSPRRQSRPRRRGTPRTSRPPRPARRRRSGPGAG